MGTEFVEHFFGLAQMILLNFNYGEFLKMVKHIELRQKLLLSGKFKETRERHSASGYIMDYDARPLTSDDKELATIKLTDCDLNELVSLGFHEAYHICKDLLKILASLPTLDAPIDLAPLGSLSSQSKIPGSTCRSSDSDSDEENEETPNSDSDENVIEDVFNMDLPLGPMTAAAARDTAHLAAISEDIGHLQACIEDREIAGSTPNLPTIKSLGLLASVDNLASHSLSKSDILDGSGKISILAMLEYRKRLQSGTTVHSERSVRLNPKFEAAEKEREDILKNSGVVAKLSMKEASHCLRIGQQLDGLLQKTLPKKDREMRWLSIAQGLHLLLHPEVGNYGIFHTNKRMYIGEILDMYKKTASGRYGSVANIGSATSLQAISVRVYLPLTMATTCDDEEDEAPIFSCSHGQFHLHMYAPIDSLLYRLGAHVFQSLGQGSQLKARFALKEEANAHWLSLTRYKVARKLPKLSIRIPGRKQDK
ncbi:hypothetical protein C0992_006337 [Termitomyces sp. T32_za158]|nr:hypothetical protein C0992_006337 [Termitomyces sp. T32_za158]